MIIEVLDGKEQYYLIPTHVHALLHKAFYLLACVCDESVKVLNKVGVLKLVADELVAFTRILNWDQVCQVITNFNRSFHVTCIICDRIREKINLERNAKFYQF